MRKVKFRTVKELYAGATKEEEFLEPAKACACAASLSLFFFFFLCFCGFFCDSVSGSYLG